MKSYTYAILTACMLAGCASSGNYVDQSNMKSLIKGKTTMDQAVGMLGQPTSRTMVGSGQTVLTYTYSEATTRPESFIPVVGAFVGGADSRFTMATLAFGPDGILTDYTYTGSQSGLSTGLASGASNQRVKGNVRQSGQSTVE